MTTLTEFLLERIAEDEVLQWHDADCTLIVQGRPDPAWGWECDCDAPARIKAECEAKRRIVNEWLAFDSSSLRDAQPFKGLLTNMLCHLALPYAEHPSWREEWRP